MAREALDDLIRLAAGGERAPLESLLTHFHDELLRFIRNELGRRPRYGITAEDALQEAFLGVFQNIQTLEPRGHQAFFMWVKSIAASRIANMIKAGSAKKRGGGRQAVAHLADSHSTAQSVLQQIAGPDLAPSRIAQRKETLAAIAKLLTQLDPVQREIVALRYGEGYSPEAVAVKIGRSEGAVKMALNRIIKDLRRKMDADSEEFSVGA